MHGLGGVEANSYKKWLQEKNGTHFSQTHAKMKIFTKLSITNLKCVSVFHHFTIDYEEQIVIYNTMDTHYA